MIRLLKTMVAVGLLPLALSAPAAAELTASQWREDLDVLAEHVRSRHQNAFHSITEEAFESEVETLRAAIPSLDSATIVVEMIRLVASVNDGHTRLTLPVDYEHLGLRLGHNPDPEPAPGVPRFGTLPVRFRALGGDVHVVATTTAFEDHLGARVVSIGGTPVEAALEAVGLWVSSDTSSGKELMAARNLGIPTLLAAAGVTERGAAVTVELLKGDRHLAVELPHLAYGAEDEWLLLGSMAPTPVWLTRRDDWFWLDYLEEERALYVQINRMNDVPLGETFGEFGRRVDVAIARHRPERVILDLRHCHGGDGTLGRAVVLPLIRWPGSSEPGGVVTLVGPETFSAAVLLLDRLEEWTQNMLVGSEPGSGPVSYGDGDREVLPNSKLVARVSTTSYKGWTGGDRRTSYDLDLPVDQTAEALASGRDLVLEAALRHQPGEGLAEQLIRAFDLGTVNSSLFIGFRSRTDPRTADRSLEAPMNTFAAHVLESGNARFAANLYLYNREYYPDSFTAWLGEADAWLKAGNVEAARNAIDEARELSPDDPELSEIEGRIAAAEADS